VDSPDTNAVLARDAGLEFPILSDPDLHTTDAYGLRHPGGGPDGQDIAHSASVLIDRDGIVRWVYVTQNVRVRPPPEVVVAAIDDLPAARGAN
jgi:peroxiredoxin